MTAADFRYAARTLAKAPTFTLVAAATIALGICANTALFTVVNALLLRPLPYGAPERLVMVWQDLTARGGPSDEWATPGNVVDWQSEPGLFDGLAAVSGWRPALTGEGDAEAILGEQVTHGYFDVLGITPQAGRTFEPADDRPGAPRVAVISDEFWQRRFGRDRSVVGRSLALNGEPHEVIGILPPGFRPVIVSDAEIWRPLRLDLAQPSREAVFLRVVARLPNGSTIGDAQARATALAQRIEQSMPEFNDKVGFRLQPLHDRVVGEIRPGLLALLGAVTFVLLIACTNVASLLMARGSTRGRELAVRLALGASRWRVIRQLLAESLLLAAIGGVAGLLIAIWAVDGLVRLAPAGTPRLDEISLDTTVLAFTLVVTTVTGVLFGLAPALQYSRVDVSPVLKDGARGSAGGGRRFRGALIAAEVALPLVLLTGGALLVQTFARLQQADLGFRTNDMLVATFQPPAASYPEREQYMQLYTRVLERAAAIPGVEQAAFSTILPLATGDSDMDLTIEGRPAPASPSDAPVSWYRSVSANYFATIGRRIVQGRGFTESEPMPVVIVNESFVARYLPGQDPIGRRIRPGSGGDGPWFTIVGVLADARVRGARERTPVELFVPYQQYADRGTWIVLAGPNAARFAPALRAAMAEIDPNLPLMGVRTLDDRLAESLGQERFFATLSAGFALLALVLAAVGIYGVMAYSVRQRTMEIGVRMALGSSVPGVFRLIIVDGLRVALIGVAIGLVGALAMGRTLESLLFGVEATDPVTLALATVTLVAVALAACAIPAWRASRVQPIMALRGE